MIIQFTLQDLMIFLVCVLAIVVGILLLNILWHIKKGVGVWRALLETNKEGINKTIRTMPGIFENVEHISVNVRETTDKLKVSVPMIVQEVECITSTAKGSVELAGVAIETMGLEINDTIVALRKGTTGFIDYFHIIEEVLQLIYRTFSSRK